MKRKISVLTLAGLMAFGATSVAAAKAPAISPSVYIDGDSVTFRADPYIQKGTTMVEFRAAFEKLGYTIDWDGETHKITATKGDSVIHLQIGSTKADVDGEQKDLSLAPVTKNDITFVPLRWIGEASGREVSWDGVSNSVYIAPTEMQLKHVLELQVGYTEQENLKGALSLIDEQSPAYAPSQQVYAQQFALFDLKFTLKDVQVVSVEGDQAAVKTVIDLEKVNGPDGLDNNVTTSVHLLAKRNGQWKISQSQNLLIDYKLADQFPEQAIALTSDDQKKIIDAEEQYRLLSEKEDFDGLLKLYDPSYPDLDNMIQTSKQVAAAYDLKFKTEEVKILSATDTEAKVKVTSTISKVSGPAFIDTKVVAVDTWKKDASGNWKISDDATLSIEYLVEGQ